MAVTSASGRPPTVDDLVDLRPAKLRARLLFWAALSLALHVGVGLALAWSPLLRNWVFSSFRSTSDGSAGTLGQIRASRAALDHLTRKRIVESARKMLLISRQVADLRAKEWSGVEQRATANAHFKAMFDAGLPRIDLIADPGDPAALDVPALFARAVAIETQVMSLYEQYKAVGLSLMTVSAAKGGSPQPQALADSLRLTALERPDRAVLDLAMINAPLADLMTTTQWRAWREHLTLASDTAEVMANNCQRVIEVIEKVVAVIEVTGSDPTPGGVAGEWWKEDHAYRGDSLRSDEMVASDLVSIDKNAKVTLGRHLGRTGAADSRAAEWLAIDTWWWIGPFPYLTGSRTKESLTHAYPPEHGVDLDAVYVGKSLSGQTRTLRWQYRPMSQVRMEPRDVFRESIWYFYTELWSAEAREILVNVASDDYGALWLNDDPKPVYTSGTDPRPWVILDQRQFVKLKLRKGNNHLLLKLDNNGGTTGFSVIFKLLADAASSR